LGSFRFAGKRTQNDRTYRILNLKVRSINRYLVKNEIKAELYTGYNSKRNVPPLKLF